MSLCVCLCAQVLPIWQNPHKFAQHKQAPALRSLTAAEREVLLLLGSDISSTEGHILIQENDKVRGRKGLNDGRDSMSWHSFALFAGTAVTHQC